MLNRCPRSLIRYRMAKGLPPSAGAGRFAPAPRRSPTSLWYPNVQVSPGAAASRDTALTAASLPRIPHQPITNNRTLTPQRCANVTSGGPMCQVHAAAASGDLSALGATAKPHPGFGRPRTQMPVQQGDSTMACVFRSARRTMASGGRMPGCAATWSWVPLSGRSDPWGRAVAAPRADWPLGTAASLFGAGPV